MSEAKSITEIPPVAFAVGGLGGNNAFGAGFLQAALDNDIEPAMITCTSGQIWWVSKYVQVAKREATVPPSDYLRKEMEKFIESTEPYHQRDLDMLYMNLHGKQGMMRTAFPEFILDTMKNTISAFERILQQGKKVFLTRELMSEWPVRVLIPQFPDKFFADISDVLNKCDIGIAFNSYDPNEGMEIVHLNPKAKELLDKEPGEKSAHRSRTLYKDIKPEYVRNGLWLFQYGFEECSIIDGCYFRGVMLSEAAIAKNIFVARPINKKWIGKLPTNYIENEDLKTEVFFNGSYQGERDKIELINSLLPKEEAKLEEGVLKKYHDVKLCEIEMETQRGFFDYLFEDIGVFDRARELADAQFNSFKRGKT